MNEFDCISKEDAIYQGYDTEDDSEIYYGFSVSEPEIEDDSGIDDTDDPEGAADDAEWGTSDHSKADDSGIEDADSYSEISTESEADESWMSAEWSVPGIGRSVSSESYVFDGREFKNLQQYNWAIYRMDVSQHPQLSGEEAIELAYPIRRGMLCECRIQLDKSFDRKKHQNHLVDKPEKVLPRLKQTDEEKAWVESLSAEELHTIMTEGWALQKKLLSSNLPLVIAIAGKEHNKMEFQDRVQAGNFGLLKAVQYFNPYKGCRFSTIATKLIRHEIRNTAKKERRQKAGPKIWENKVPTEWDVDRVCERMGGRAWMCEVTVDTGFPANKIRKQIVELLQMKVYAESIANDIVLSEPSDYDIVLANAYVDTGHLAKDNDREQFDSDYCGKNPRFDIMTGDGKAPKPGEMSFEDYVRSFFNMVIDVKNVDHDKLGEFVFGNSTEIRKKANELRSFLDGQWKYTTELAIAELDNYIRTGEIWPERPLLNQVKEWAEIEQKKAANELTGYIDIDYPTESIAMILFENYVSLRREDIWIDARLSMEYYDWLSGILDLAEWERHSEKEKEILNDLVAGEKYKTIQEEHNMSPNTVKRRKDAIARNVYDQIIASTNREYGNVLLKRLIQRYQARLIREWIDSIIGRMKDDHFVEKKRFALRCRGEADSPRPKMEGFIKTITGVVDTIASLSIDFEKAIAPINEAMQNAQEIITSETFEAWKKEWNEIVDYVDVGDLEETRSELNDVQNASEMSDESDDFESDSGMVQIETAIIPPAKAG